MFDDNSDTDIQSSYSKANHQEDLESLVQSLRIIDIFSVSRRGASGFDNKDNRLQVNIINQAKACIGKAGAEAGYVWFEVFKAAYTNRLKLNEWTGELTFNNKPDNQEGLIDKLEQTLQMMMKLSREQFDRKFQVWIKDQTFNPVRQQIEEIARQVTHKWIHPGTESSTISIDPKTILKDRNYNCIFGHEGALDILCSTGGFIAKDLESMADWDNLANILDL